MTNLNYMLRKMTARDLDRIMEIETESFTLPWSKDSYQGELNNRFATYMVVDYEGDVAGYGGIWVVFEEAHITNVAVAQTFRRFGMGRAIMLELEKNAIRRKARHILLEVRPSNLAALNMYKSMDYISNGYRKGYYSDNNEDAIIMIKYLTPNQA